MPQFLRDVRKNEPRTRATGASARATGTTSSRCRARWSWRSSRTKALCSGWMTKRGSSTRPTCATTTSVWTLDALRRKYVLCRCAPVGGREPTAPGPRAPAGPGLRRAPAARGLGPDEGCRISGRFGLGSDGPRGDARRRRRDDVRPPRGPLALRPAFDELVGAERLRLLFYAFFRPAAPIRAYVAKALERRAFDVAVHVRISARARTRRSRSSAAAGAGDGRRRGACRRRSSSRIEAQPWFDALGRAQLPRLLLAAGRVLRDAPRLGVFSDRPSAARALAARLPGAVALDSGNRRPSFRDGVAALTSQERERAMLRSADWGASPRGRRSRTSTSCRRRAGGLRGPPRAVDLLASSPRR